MGVQRFSSLFHHWLLCYVLLCCVCVLRLFVWFGKDGSGFDRVGKKREVV